MYLIRIIIWLILSSFPVSYVGASNFFDETRPSVDLNMTLSSTVTLELATDATGARDTLFTANYGLQSGNRLKLGIGETSFDGQIDDSIFYSFGFTGNPLTELMFGFSYTFLEREESLLFRAIRLRMRKDTVVAYLTWHKNNWAVSLKPQISNILLQPRDPNANRGIRSPGFGFSVSYYGLDSFSFYVSHAEFNYSNNIELLKEIALRSGQFDEVRTSASIDYNVDWGAVGLEWQRNGAIDNIENYDVVLINLFLTLSDDWSMQGRLGSPSGGSINTDGFGSLALTYSW